jgi:hypothetical protein
MGHEMSGADEQSAPAALWARLRERYENGTESVTALAAGAGITRHALVSRARAEGWKLRDAAKQSRKAQGTRGTLSRFKALLRQRLSEFEAQIGSLSAEANAATSERDIRAMNTLVRTLEKVLDLERKERARRSARRKHERRFDDAEREALADKLAGLRRELVTRRDRDNAGQPAGPGDEGDEPGLAQLGPGPAAASTAGE